MAMSEDGLELNLDVGDPEVVSGETAEIPEEEVPENVDKTPSEEDGDQPGLPSTTTEYGELPEVDPYG